MRQERDHADGSRHAQPLRFWQRVVSAPERGQLLHLARTRRSAQAFWQARADAFDRHVARQTPRQALAWGLSRGLDRLHVVRRRLAERLFVGQTLPSTPLRAKDVVLRGQLVRSAPCLVTRDHAMLEGVLFEHAGKNQAHGSVVVIGGNAHRVQGLEPWLESLAHLTHRHVRMFNYRRYGDSIGSLCTPNTAITDARTAILSAEPRREHPCVVVGLSMGGGTGAAALRSLLREQQVQFGDVEAFIAVHSFRSLPAVIEAVYGRWTGRGARALFSLCGFDTLDTERTIHTEDLAPVVVSLRAEVDALIAPRAALRVDGLAKRTNSRDIFFVDEESGHAHCDLLDVAGVITRALEAKSRADDARRLARSTSP